MWDFSEGLFGCRKGDYYRYLSEFKMGDERKEAADQSMKAYQASLLWLTYVKLA